MNILVCVKQVPDMDTLTVVRGEDGRADLEDIAAFHMNRYDECAVEAAIRIREEFSPQVAVHVDAITAGPDRAFDVVRRAMGMGTQAGIHLRSRIDVGPEQVAAAIAHHAHRHPYDLILTGSMSEDGMHAQVGPRLAAHLDWPCAANVVRLNLDPAAGSVTVEKEIENGAREKLNLRLPAVLALQSGINRPRYPSLSNLLRANRQAVRTMDLADDWSPPPAPLLVGMFIPEKSRAGKVLPGTAGEKAEALIAILRQKALLS